MSNVLTLLFSSRSFSHAFTSNLQPRSVSLIYPKAQDPLIAFPALQRLFPSLPKSCRIALSSNLPCPFLLLLITSTLAPTADSAAAPAKKGGAKKTSA